MHSKHSAQTERMAHTCREVGQNGTYVQGSRSEWHIRAGKQVSSPTKTVIPT